MSNPQFDLDAIDLQLLERLQTDASLSNQALAELVHISPPTCLRRVKRLFDAGLIEREIAVLSVDALASLVGNGLCAVVEIQFGMLTWRPRATVSASGAVSLVKVEPPPTVPPAPMVTGATSTQLLPM